MLHDTRQTGRRDAQMAAINAFVEGEHPRFGRFRTVNSPMDVQGAEKVTPGPAPELGEHTTEVLTDLGYTEQQIQELLDQGAAAQYRAI